MTENPVLERRQFATFEEGVDYVEQFCKTGYHPVRHESRTTVAQYNGKVRAADARLSDLPDDAVYAQRWNCKHFGSFRARKQEDGSSRSRTHYRRGYKFFIYLAWNKECRQYEIKSCNMQHTHDIGAEHFRHYASNRLVIVHINIDLSKFCTYFAVSTVQK